MKKLWTILILCLLSLFCAVGFVACDEDNTGKEEQQQQQPADEGSGNSDGGQTATAMTKDEFITELVKRETATWANNKLHYATVDCKLVLNMGDEERDGEYEQTCDITYVSSSDGENFVYTDVKTGKDGNYVYQQQDVLFLSSYFNSMFGQMPADMLSAFKFEKNGDKLKLLVDIEYTAEETTVKVYMEYEFDANGYLTYRKESGARSIEFTAKAYNRTKDLDIDAFLACLHELENGSYDFRRYATLTDTVNEEDGTDTEVGKTETIDLVYDYDGDEHKVVYARNLTVLGLSYLIEDIIADEYNDEYHGEYEVKKVGSTYDFMGVYDTGILHFIFDKDGYLIYSYEKEGDDYVCEFNAISYNKVGVA